MTSDNAIRRAAGIIVWHMEQGHSIAESLARAQKREPELDESEIGQAFDWAIAALRFAELFATAKPDERVWDIMKRAGLPVEAIAQENARNER